MAQFVDFACLPDRDGAWHLGTVRRLLREVAGAPTQRKLTAWLRQVKIYDRTFIGQLVRLVDLKVAARVTLGPFGQELVEALAESEKLEKAAAAAEPDSRPRAGRAVAPDPTEEDFPTGEVTIEDLARRTAGRPRDGEEGEGGAGRKAAAQPETTVKDPFKEALFDRFVELNGYLVRFIFCEVADGFLAPSEMVKRLGSSIYRGERPQLLPFQSWLKWMEWLGYVRGVGFRQRLTARGIEAWKYLKEIPEEELLEGGGSPLEAFALDPASSLETPAPEAVAESPPPTAAASARPAATPGPGRVPEAEADDEGEEAADGPPPARLPTQPAAAPSERRDEELADEEGLDLPPEAEAPEGEGGGTEAADEGPAGAEEDEEAGVADEILAALRGEAPAAADATADAAGANGGARADEPGDGAGGAPAVAEEAEEEAEEQADGEGEEEEGAEEGGEEEGEDEESPRPTAPAPPIAPAASVAAGDFSARMRALAAEAAAIPERVRGREPAAPAPATAARGAPAPAPASARAPAPAPPAAPPPPAAPAPPPPAPATPVPAPAPATARAPRAPAPAPAGSPGDAVAALWECAPDRRPCAAPDFGFKVEHYDKGGDAKPLFLFKLAALALLLEAPGSFAAKATLFRELARTRAFEGLFLHGWPLEQALEKLGLLRPDRDWTAVEERLAHLPRLRRGLKDGGEALVARLEGTATPERAAALRGEVLGNSLGAGIYWLEREMRRLGLWR